jgi:hypothetical protein
MSTFKDKIHDMPTDYYQDDLYAFFINCYHLKDWVKNDPEISTEVKGDIENFIANSEELSICADICNGSKHLKLKAPRKDPNTKVDARHFSLYLGHGPVIHIEYMIESGGKIYDAHLLATKCLKAWDIFLKKYRLLS